MESTLVDYGLAGRTVEVVFIVFQVNAVAVECERDHASSLWKILGYPATPSIQRVREVSYDGSEKIGPRLGGGFLQDQVVDAIIVDVGFFD